MTITGPGGAVSSVSISSCSVKGLTGLLTSKGTVTFANGFVQDNAPISGLTLANLIHPAGLSTTVDGQPYAIPSAATLSLGPCLSL